MFVLVSQRSHEPTYFLFIIPANSDQSHASVLNIDVTGSLYYHQSETKMADSSDDELSDFSGNLSVVSEEDFEVSSISEDSVREDDLEIEHDSVFLVLSLSEDRTSLEISRKTP